MDSSEGGEEEEEQSDEEEEEEHESSEEEEDDEEDDQPPARRRKINSRRAVAVPAAAASSPAAAAAPSASEGESVEIRYQVQYYNFIAEGPAQLMGDEEAWKQWVEERVDSDDLPLDAVALVEAAKQAWADGRFTPLPPFVIQRWQGIDYTLSPNNKNDFITQSQIIRRGSRESTLSSRKVKKGTVYTLTENAFADVLKDLTEQQ